MSLQAASLYALVSVAGAGQSVKDLQGVSGQVNKTQGVLKGLGKNVGQIGKGFGQVGAGILRIGEIAATASVGLVIASAKVGTTFEAMTELIHTQAGATQKEVDAMRVGIQAMVHEVGTGPNELAKGLYHIESVGVRGAAALDILKAAALGAKVGLADMESVTNALTAVWFSNIKGAKSMTDAMAILDGIVGVGNMHLQDLTDSFKSGILGTSATYGVDIRSLGAAMATLTDAGVPAQITATRLNNTLTHLAAPTKIAAGVLGKLGLSQFQLAEDLRKPDGIFVALQDLHDHLAGSHMAAGMSAPEIQKANDQLSVAVLRLSELEKKHNVAASTLLAARNRVTELRAKLAAGAGSMQGPEIVNGQLTPQGAADMSKLFGGSRFGATAMQLLTAMDRIPPKYDKILERSKTFGENVQATMETAGFKWGQFRADIEEAALSFSQGFLPSLARAGSKLDAFLLGHMGDIKTLGVQLGGWLDKIDWKGVEDGANGFLGVLKSVVDIVSKVPPQIDLAIVGFLALNKLSGGLVGKGLENIVGGLAGGVATIGKNVLRSLLVKVPGIGGAIGAATALHVWVDNPGFGMPGGPPGIPPIVEAGGAGLLGTLAAVAAPVIATAAVAAVAANQNLQISDQSDALRKQTAEYVKVASTTDMKNAATAIVEQLNHTPGNAYGVKGTLTDVLNQLLAEIDRRGRLGNYNPNPATPGNANTREDRNTPFGAGFANANAREDRASSDALASAAKQLAATVAGLPASLQAKLSVPLKDMLSGIAERSQAKYHWKSGKPPESWVQGTFGRDILHTEKMILRTHSTAATKLAGVESLQRLAVQNKDWGVAAKLKTDIAALQDQVRKQNLSVDVHPQPVTFAVDGTALVKAVIYSRQWQRGTI